MTGYRLRPATAEDLPAVLAILDGAITWLGGQGLDQWQGGRWRAEELSPALAAGDLRVAETWSRSDAPSSTAVATMVLSEESHSCWLPADDLASALYLGRLAVDRGFAGRKIGAWLLDHAAAEAARRGKRKLRLDAWTTNTRLHAYYRNHGFRLVRIVDGSSGALFERDVSPP